MLQREAHAATALSALQRPHRSRSPAATMPRRASPPYAIPLKHSFIFQKKFHRKILDPHAGVVAGLVPFLAHGAWADWTWGVCIGCEGDHVVGRGVGAAVVDPVPVVDDHMEGEEFFLWGQAGRGW